MSVVAGFASLALTQACGPQQPSRRVTRTSVHVEISTAALQQVSSCDSSLEDGDKVPASAASNPEIETLGFGKPVDLAPIHALKSASLKSTIEIIQSRGIRLFKAERPASLPQALCHPFSNLSEAPAELREVWDMASKDAEKIQGYVMAFYVPKTAEPPTIVIRTDANRAILMHEFMHHLFSERSEQLGLPSIWERLEKLESHSTAYNDLLKTYEPEKLTATGEFQAETEKLALSFLAYSRALRDYLRHKELEEIAIETYFQKEIARDVFSHFPHDRKSSDQYIQSSALQAEVTLRFLTRTCQRFHEMENGLGPETQDLLLEELGELLQLSLDIIKTAG